MQGESSRTVRPDETDSTTGRTRSNRRTFLRASALAGTGLLAGCIGSGATGGGRALTIGYQPFYSEAWSALVIKHSGLAEKYLPEGYTVKRWDSALQGSIIGTRMITGKNQVGYTGDMPSILALANDKTPIDAVGLAGFSEGQQCNIGIVPNGSPIESVDGLDKTEVGVTTGACSHRCYLNVTEQANIDPKLSDLGIGTILAQIREGGIQAGFAWEPIPARSVYQTDQARYLLTGAMFDLVDAAGIIMPDSLVENRPEVAVGWLKAEFEAKRLMATRPERALDLIGQEADLSAYDRSTLRACLYESIPLNPDINRFEFVTDIEAVDAANEVFKQSGPKFLKEQGIISEMPAEARYRSDIAQQAAKALGAETGLDRFGGSADEDGPGGSGQGTATPGGNQTESQALTGGGL